MSQESQTSSARPRPELSLFDTTAIIVGIIIGSGLYVSPSTVAGCVADGWQLMGVWLLGGIFAFVGALCYAELATTYPAEGGDYVFLTRAYGRGAGFLFAWLQLWVVRPGSIGAMAFVYGTYVNQFAPLPDYGPTFHALVAIATLTFINIQGVKPGKWTQDILTSAKVIGLITVVLLGLIATPAESAQTAAPVADAQGTNLKLAMIMVLFTYGGWNEMAYVAAEVKDPQRNIVRALIYGTGAVVAIYLAVNLVMVRTLGLAGMAGTRAVAAAVVENAVGDWGGKAVSLLICISALGSMNGMTFTGSRIYYAMGRDHRLFAPLGRWHPRLETPVNSLVTEAVITCSIILALALSYGSDPKYDPFELLVVFTAPFFWLFLMLTGSALIILRYREPNRQQGFRVPLFPLSPLAFMAVCGFMVWSGVTYATFKAGGTFPPELIWSLALFTAGAGLAVVETWHRNGGGKG